MVFYILDVHMSNIHVLPKYIDNCNLIIYNKLKNKNKEVMLMITTDAYVSTLFSIIIATITAICKEKNKKLVVLLASLIPILTIIYKYDADISYTEYFFSEFVFLPFSKRTFAELPSKELTSIIVSSFGINLLSYYMLRFKIEGDFLNIKFNKKYLIITIVISFVISSCLHILLYDLISHKLFILINNEMLSYFLSGGLIYFIAAFEAWLLYSLNLYLSFKKLKSK